MVAYKGSMSETAKSALEIMEASEYWRLDETDSGQERIIDPEGGAWCPIDSVLPHRDWLADLKDIYPGCSDIDDRSLIPVLEDRWILRSIFDFGGRASYRLLGPPSRSKGDKRLLRRLGRDWNRDLEIEVHWVWGDDENWQLAQAGMDEVQDYMDGYTKWLKPRRW